ncbi:UNVERIFIED_CONTAM: 4Fe-4S single cluster protein [Acetivibrio alkalicellulosi]
MIRIYINITNQCNTNCPFCCMYSGTEKSTYMSFNKYKEIIDFHKKDFELQLEGGEPLLHEDLYLFLEYARSTKRCKKIILSTNGILLDSHFVRLVDFNKYNKIPITVKLSINYWLHKENPRCFEKALDWHLATEFIEGFNIKLNVRLRNQDQLIRDEINNNNLGAISNIYYLQSYGKLSGNKDYEKPVIVQNIDDWFLYSTDGTCFNKDLIARSEHEGRLL